MTQSGQTSNEGPKNHQGPPPPPPPPPRPARKIQRVPKLLLKEEKNRDNYIPMVVSIGPYHHGKPELHLVESFKPTAKFLFFLGSKKKEDHYYEEIEKKIIEIKNCYEEDGTLSLLPEIKKKRVISLNRSYQKKKDCTKSYSKEDLVRMMLLDACFIIIYMETSCIEGHPQSDHEKMIARNASHMFQKLGVSTMSTVLRDMFLLENQIPLWIIKLLLESRYDGSQPGEELLDRYMTRSLFGDFRAKRNVPGEYPEELHLIEAFHRLVIFGFVHETKKTSLSFINRKFFCCFEAKEKNIGDSNTDIESGVSSQGKSRFQSRMNYLTAGNWRKLSKNVRNEGDHAKGHFMGFINSFRSVTDLKAAGIHFIPNQTLSLKDVVFEPYCIFGKLQLPFWCVSTHTKVFFMNMIAYEFSPDKFRPDNLNAKFSPDKFRPDDLNASIVTAYINLMKSLIVRPEDVKELREKKILRDMLRNDEEILRVYQDINTFGVDNSSIFYEVSHKIQAHCNGKAKRWIPELINTYFRSPWSFIALLATTYLLVLTTLQTIYTMKV